MRRTFRFILMALVFTWSGAAWAQVEIAFYSKDTGSTFPHAYVRLTGTLDSSGQPIDVNYGFTPVSVSPGVLWGPVRGMIESALPEYVSRSDRHFALKLSPQQYRRVIAIVEKWRDAPQPSYRLNGRNCIDFVAEIANTLGINAPVIPKLMKKPRSYLDEVARLNASTIASWDAREVTPPALATQQ
jgi:hypothetical protein